MVRNVSKKILEDSMSRFKENKYLANSIFEEYRQRNFFQEKVIARAKARSLVSEQDANNVHVTLSEIRTAEHAMRYRLSTDHQFHRDVELALRDWQRSPIYINGRLVEIHNMTRAQLLHLWKKELLQDVNASDSHPLLVFLAKMARQSDARAKCYNIFNGLAMGLSAMATLKDWHWNKKDLNKKEWCLRFTSINESTLVIEQNISITELLDMRSDMKRFSLTNDKPITEASIRYRIRYNAHNDFIDCQCTDLVIKHHCMLSKELFDHRTVLERIKDWFKWLFRWLLGRNIMPTIEPSAMRPR